MLDTPELVMTAEVKKDLKKVLAYLGNFEGLELSDYSDLHTHCCRVSYMALMLIFKMSGRKKARFNIFKYRPHSEAKPIEEYDSKTARILLDRLKDYRSRYSESFTPVEIYEYLNDIHGSGMALVYIIADLPR